MEVSSLIYELGCFALGEIHAEPIFSCKRNQLWISFSKTNKASRTIFKVLDTHVRTFIMANKSLNGEVDFAS
jgi:hypothetical protein